MAVVLPVAMVTLTVIRSVFIYNNLVRARNRTREAWSGIEVQLKARSSLIPNLVETVRGYATHEHEVFAEVAQARSALAKATEPAAAAAADGFLTQALGRLMAVAENYKQLQAASSFNQLQAQLSDTEEKVAYSRQFYNMNAMYNTAIQSFPSNLFARRYRFDPCPSLKPNREWSRISRLSSRPPNMTPQMTQPVLVYTRIAYNRRKTWLLLAFAIASIFPFVLAVSYESLQSSSRRSAGALTSSASGRSACTERWPISAWKLRVLRTLTKYARKKWHYAARTRAN